MTDKRLALTTCGSAEEAERIARAALEKGLAACVNVLPKIRSYYHWKGRLENDEEWLLLLKTREDHLDRLREAVRAVHSYDLPEFVVLSIEGGSKEYLAWIDESLS